MRPSSTYPWIVNPAFDFFFVCGGGVLMLVAINALTIGWTVPLQLNPGTEKILLILVLLGQHLFADSHNTATYMRIWGSPEDQQRFKFYRTWLVYSCLPLFVVGLLYPPLTSAMVYLYLIAVYWHYAAQTFGISLIYCYKRGYRLSLLERRIYRSFILSMTAVVIVRFLSFRELSPTNWFGVPIPFWGPLPPAILIVTQMVFGISAIAFAGVLVKKFVVERQAFPWPSAMLLATIVSLGLVGGTANAMLWLYVPAFFHGSQYLAVCLSYYLKERNMSESASFSSIGTMMLTPSAKRYVATVVITGTFFYVAIPHIFSQFGFDYALVAGLVLAIVNYHHFITDAAIWRLRDPRCREILLA